MTTDDDNKEMKIEFAPGCFDNFEGTQEELDEMIAEIEKMVADGTFLENSQPLDLDEMFEEDPMAALRVAIQLGILDGIIDEEGNITDPALDMELTKEDKNVLRQMMSGRPTDTTERPRRLN